MSYIQVGMKNKKYFLAIFLFITIFFGIHGRRDDVMFGRGGEFKGRGERLIRTRECFNFEDTGKGLRKAMKRDMTEEMRYVQEGKGTKVDQDKIWGVLSHLSIYFVRIYRHYNY